MTLQSGRQGSSNQRFSPQFCQDVLCSMCLLQKRASGWAAKYLGRWLVSHFHHPGSTVCSVFPLKMWFLLEADALVHMVLLRINPWEFSCKVQEKRHLWEEAKAQISGQRFPHAWTSFPFLLNLFSSLYILLSGADVRRGRHMLQTKHFFDEGELSARLNYWLLNNHSHFICLLHPSLLNTP